MIEGDYACFTRPEMKVERVSYDVPTPSALEGLLKSVYWKPAIRYCIDKIVVYKPIRFMNVRRNEVKEKAGYGFGKDNSIYTGECRSQRATMLLKDVKYGVEFHFEMTGRKSEHEDESEAKHYNIIKRRLENGQCFRTPCLGCSEFPVRSIRLVDSLPLADIDQEILARGDVDLGYMLYGLQFEDGGEPVNGDWDNPQFSDKAEARYYRPHMIGGVIDVARYKEGILC
jgi:CRISPR-associated protein Cas5d